MIDFGRSKNSRGMQAAAAALLVVVGAAGGAGAVQATRPAIVMAPAVQTPIAKLEASTGVVTVKGRVAEVFGDRFVVQDASGRAMVAVAPEAAKAIRAGQGVMVQGRFEEGQLRASYLVDQNGSVTPLGPLGPQGPQPGGPHHPGPGPQGARGGDVPPPPPPACAPAPVGAAVPTPASPSPGG